MISYFHSGWGFLIPYIAAYLLYAGLKLPVNPASDSQVAPGGGAGVSVPLLHVFWALHAIHLALGTIALRAWWKQRNARAAREGQFNTECRLVPWLCLAAIFWVPSLYLEWPSDAWEHLRRINEWRNLEAVTAHSAWTKCSYFIPYSLTQHVTGRAQLSQLNIYYTTVCLLLSWQYYRLARAAGLGERASFLFVLLNALTFGNNVFSFYRYYGLSTSLWAHLAAIALIRASLELRFPRATRPGLRLRHAARRWAPPAALLAGLAVANHPQSVGIAGAGVLAAICARWAGSRPFRIVAIPALLALLSTLALLAMPADLSFTQELMQAGWLNRWHGFNLLSPSSPAAHRAWEILGLLGCVNLLAGCLLVRWQPAVAWISMMPCLLLLTPIVALPLAAVLRGYAPDVGVLTFHRVLLGIPAGLALVALVERCMFHYVTLRAAPAWLSIGALAVGLALPPGSRAFNRSWHLLHRTPPDLRLAPLLATAGHTGDREHLLLGSNLAQNVAAAFQPLGPHPYFRLIHGTPPSNFSGTIRASETIREGIIRPASDTGRMLAPDVLHLSGDFAGSTGTASPVHLHRLTARGAAWAGLSGAPPEVSPTDGGVEVRNPSGERTYAVSSLRLSVSGLAQYTVAIALRRVAGGDAPNYLAIAWYDEVDNILPASAPGPAGAGNPTGWHNGGLSYFGLIDAAAPETWTTFTKDFGLGTPARVPPNASYFRVAAVLNADAHPGAVVSLKDVTVTVRTPYTRWDLILTAPTAWFTPASTAGLLSQHWPPHKVSMDLAGQPELSAALRDRDRAPPVHPSR